MPLTEKQWIDLGKGLEKMQAAGFHPSILQRCIEMAIQDDMGFEAAMNFMEDTCESILVSRGRTVSPRPPSP